jgi:transposase
MKYHKNTDVRLRPVDRLQVTMEMQAIDDLIPADHQARVIWQISEALDMTAFYESIRAREGRCGRDATDPRLLFSLWLYATIRGEGSARELARLCSESAPYRWLCGGVSVNHHMLSDFRVGHGAALDGLLTEVLASLVDKELVDVHRISQDGTRVRACAGSGSFRGAERLEQLLKEAQAHVEQLKQLLEDPARSAELSARQKGARERAAAERAERIGQALGQMPELKRRHEKLLKKAGNGTHGQTVKARQPRASTTDAEARTMKMGDGGFRPAYNVQVAVDTASRAIVGLAVTNEGSDSANLAEPMRKQVEQRTGRKVGEHLMDGGYTVLDDIDRAAAEGVTLYTPPKPSRNKDKRGDEFQPRKTDSPAVAAWRQTMGTPEAQKIYKERASTVETVNADIKQHRGLRQFTVQGMQKALSVALWAALAYNLIHFGQHLLT